MLWVSRCARPSCVLLFALGSCSQPAGSVVTAVQSELVQAFEQSEQVDVIVSLREPAGAADAAMQAQRSAVMADLGSGLVVSRVFRNLPGLSGRIDKRALDALSRDPRVAYVQLDGRGSGLLKEAVPAIGADQVASKYKLSGRGVRVAVLDTGADLEHPDLKKTIVGQHCYTANDCAPFKTSEGSNAQDDHGHGTGVAGALVSQGSVSSVGYAPGVELVAVKVMNETNNGRESDFVAGLDWVYDNRDALKIRIVNLSIGTDAMHADSQECDRAHPLFAASIKKLVSAGVTVFAAAGNKGSTTSMPAPACNTGVISVGATYDSDAGKQPSDLGYLLQVGSSFANCSDATTATDQIACFSNSTAKLDLLAPGAPITADALGGGTKVWYGTSFAAPAAVGVAAMMLECNPALTPGEIKQHLVVTGSTQTDARNSLSFPVVRAVEAVQSACPGIESGVSPLPSVDAGAPPPAADGGSPPASAPTTTTGAESAANLSAALGSRYLAGSRAAPFGSPASNIKPVTPGAPAGGRAAAAGRGGEGGRASATTEAPADRDSGCSVVTTGHAAGSMTPWFAVLTCATLGLRVRARARGRKGGSC